MPPWDCFRDGHAWGLDRDSNPDETTRACAYCGQQQVTTYSNGRRTEVQHVRDGAVIDAWRYDRANRAIREFP